MATWKMTMAMALTGVLAAGPAFAQATTGGAPASGTETKGEQPKGTPAQPDSAGQTPRSGGSMKSDTSKSDGHMRSGMSRGHKGAAMGGGMDHEKVKAAQQALKDKGHDPGDVDGRMGPKTQQALRDFQKAQGIQATGRLDAKTMQSLGVEGGRTSSTGESSTSGSASPSASGSSTGSSSTTSPSSSGAAGEKK